MGFVPLMSVNLLCIFSAFFSSSDILQISPPFSSYFHSLLPLVFATGISPLLLFEAKIKALDPSATSSGQCMCSAIFIIRDYFMGLVSLFLTYQAFRGFNLGFQAERLKWTFHLSDKEGK